MMNLDVMNLRSKHCGSQRLVRVMNAMNRCEMIE